MSIDWTCNTGAIWRPRAQQLRAVARIDPVQAGDLLGIDRQKQALLDNTARFVAGLPANNALLWGTRGTGKSSLVKAVVNAFSERGLRVVQVDRDDLVVLPDIVDALRDQPFRFLVFCDDLSFAAGDQGYRALKSVLEGSIEPPAANVRVYATSNRRHLVASQRSDNEGVQVAGTELHYGDEVEEKVSLADRFGLWLSFYPITQDAYLAIVDHLAALHGVAGRPGLHADALRFAQDKTVRSGRTARQFIDAIAPR